MEPQFQPISELIAAARGDLHEIRNRCCRDQQVTGEAFDRILDLFKRLREPPSDGLAFALLEVADGRVLAQSQEVSGLMLAASRRIESDSGEILRLRTDLLAAERLAEMRQP